MRSRTLMLAAVLTTVAAGCTNPTAVKGGSKAEPSLSQSTLPVPVPITQTQNTASDSTGGGERGSGGFGSGH